MRAFDEWYAAAAAALRSALLTHATLLRNVSALAAGTAGSSVLGFIYWWVAARFFSLEAVGLMAAAISAMSLIALVAQVGLGTILIRESSVQQEKAPGLIAAALIVSAALAAALGFLFLMCARASSLDLGEITRPGLSALCFVLGCCATCVAAVLNNAFVGLLRGSLQMHHTVAFAALKLVFLAALAVAAGAQASEGAIFATWAVGQAICSFLFIFFLRSFNHGAWPNPNFSELRRLIPASFSYHFLDLVIQIPSLGMPFLVTVVLSPEVNAAFNAGWMMLRVTYLLPVALATMIFAMGRTEHDAYVARVRLSIALSAAAACAIALLFGVFSDLLLSIFNKEYPAIASDSLRVLSFSYFPVSIAVYYLTIKRVNREVMAASGIFIVGGGLELLFALSGGYFGGLIGLSAGWTLAMILQAAFMGREVFSSAETRFNVIRLIRPANT